MLTKIFKTKIRLVKPIQIFSLSLLLTCFVLTTNAQCDMDSIPPNGNAVTLSSAVLDPTTFEVELYAIDFFISATDNCDHSDSLRYTFSATSPESDNNYLEQYRSSSKIYDCVDEANSPLLVDLYVWDMSGNYSFFNVDLTLVSTTSTNCEGCDMNMDSIPPNGYVVDLSTAVLNSTTFDVELYAIDFFIEANDNCDSLDSLRYTFTSTPPESDNNYLEQYRSSSKIYDCIDEANSPLVVDLYVWDMSGNYSHFDVDLTLVTTQSNGCVGCDMDTISPVANPVANLQWLFPEDSVYIEIWASDFVFSATDNCTSSELIKYSFTPTSPFDDPSSSVMTYDCYDIENSPFNLAIYTWDKNGNYSIDSSILVIAQQPGQDCTTAFEDIEGLVINLDEEPIEGATVYLEKESGEVIESTLTDEQGRYSFTTNTINKYLSIEYSDDSEPNISYLDLIAIQQYLLGLDQFSMPQQIASDINADGRVRVNDLIMMRKFILGIIAPNQHINQDWQFVNQDVINYESASSRFSLNSTIGPTIVGYRIGDVR